jgi:RimJ/RimL family protein N-acetyltransferase
MFYMTSRSRIRITKANPSDAETLAEVSKRAFHSDVNYGAPAEGGPPGYDSTVWQRKMMGFGDYYKIVREDRVIGGIIVFRKRPREYELGRIFLEPEFQNRGIGTRAFEFLWQAYPLAKRWTLDTPAWHERNRHFYKKVGFVEIGEDSQGGVMFERRIPAGSSRRGG